MHSIVGSYRKPPDRIFAPSFTQNDELSRNHHSVNFEVTSPKRLHSPNNQALILALKTLQEKIHRLELERTQAEDNLNILSKEAAQYKKALEDETNERNLVHQELIKQKKRHKYTIKLSSGSLYAPREATGIYKENGSQCRAREEYDPRTADPASKGKRTRSNEAASKT